MQPGLIDLVGPLAIGFALAGVVATGLESWSGRQAGLAMLQTGDRAALAHVPLLVAAAPLLILRLLLSRTSGYRPGFLGATILTALAGGWSLASGRLVLDLACLVAGA